MAPKKGSIPWNKGLTKETDVRVAQYANAISDIMQKKVASKEYVAPNKGKKGKQPWNKGLTKEIDDRVAQYGMDAASTKLLKFNSGELVIWNKGKKGLQEAWNKGKIGKNVAWNKGLTKETDERITRIAENRSRAGNAQFLGGVHPRFNPDKDRPYSSEFNFHLKEYIKNLDFRRCFNCELDNRLQIHHINWDKTSTEIDNLITLCTSCHMRAHGKKNKESYQNLFYAWVAIREV